MIIISWRDQRGAVSHGSCSCIRTVEKEPGEYSNRSASPRGARECSELKLTFALLDSIHAKADWVHCPLLPLCCAGVTAQCRGLLLLPPLQAAPSPPTLPRLTELARIACASSACPTPNLAESLHQQQQAAAAAAAANSESHVAPGHGTRTSTENAEESRADCMPLLLLQLP